MKKVNVLCMEDFKELKELKTSADNYSSYLRSLEDTQLAPETNFLLNEFSNGVCGKDFSQKVQLVLEEIALRADIEVRHSIQKLNKETISLL